MIDIAKLPPVPWGESELDGTWMVSHPGDAEIKRLRAMKKYPITSRRICLFEPSHYLSEEEAKTCAEAYVLMRSDLDVKLRRGWHTEKCQESDEWIVPQVAAKIVILSFRGEAECGDLSNAYQTGHDIGLLTKADQWMTAHEGGAKP